MNKKLIWIIAMFLIVSTILIHEASAIGITPGRTVIDFEAKLHREIKFTVVNTEHKDMKVLLKLDADKELEKDATLSAEFAEFTAAEESKEFTLSINLDRASLGKPGDYKIDIIAQELTPTTEKAGKYVGVSLAVASQIIIRAPFPGKHVNFKFEIDEHPGEIRFLIPVFNLGSENIANAKASISILGESNKEIAKLFSTEGPIDAKGRRELTALWDTREVKSGLYYAIVLLDYDGKTETYETTFAVGNPSVEIKSVKVNNFKLGEVAKFEIEVESKWQEMIPDLFAELIVYDKDNKPVSSTKSSTTEIAPDSKTTLEAFWDTAGFSSGFYTASIVLHYKGNVKETKLNLEVTLDQIKTSLLSQTAQVVAVDNSNLKRNSAVAIAVLVLILLNFIWFRYLKLRKTAQE